VCLGCGTIPSFTDGGSQNSSGKDAAAKMVDAGQADAPRQDGDFVTVKVTTNGVPVDQVPVVLHAETGTPIADQITDGNGEAVFGDVKPHSMITIAIGVPGDNGITTRHLMTIAEVNAGDLLSLNVEAPMPAGTANVGIKSPVTSATSYLVSLGDCRAMTSSAPSTVVLELHANCVDEGSRTVAIQALALGSAGPPYINGKPLGYAFQKDVRFTGGGTGFVDLTLGAFNTDFATIRLIPKAVPPDATVTYGAVSPMIGSAVFGAIDKIGGRLFGSDDIIVEYVPGFGDRLQLTMGLGYVVNPGPNSQPDAMRIRTMRVSPMTGEVSLDMSQLLPRIRNVGRTMTGDQPVVTWEVDDPAGTRSQADFLHVMLAWPPLAGPNKNTWQVLHPPGVITGFTFPVLPSSLAEWKPTGEIGQTVKYINVKDFMGFDAVKQHLGEPFGLEVVPDEGYPIDVSAGGLLDI
jgi:hypothetical protein